MALHPSVYLGNLLLFAFSNFKASAEHHSSIEYPSDTPLNYSNFNASQILQYLIDKHLKLNCANLNGSFDSKNSTDPETTQLNHNSEEYHHRMKRCSELERHNKILQEFAGRKSKENVSAQAHKANKSHIKKNPHSTTSENHSDLDHDEGRGDMAHHSPTDILATNSVTEPQPLNVYTMEEEDRKILAKEIQQQFNMYQHGFEVSSEFPTSPTDRLRDQSAKTDKLPTKPPSLLTRIRTVMEGGSLKDKSSSTDASTFHTNKYDNSSSTTPLISHNPNIPKNVFELITNRMSRGGNSASDSSSSAAEGKYSENAPFMTENQDSVTNGVKNIEQKSKENGEKIQVKDANQNTFYVDPTTISSLRSSSGSQVTNYRSTFAGSSQKINSPISETKFIKKKNDRSSQLSTRSTSTTHIKKQTSEKIRENDLPTRAQTSISTQVPKSTPSLIKHGHPSVIPEMKISSMNKNKHHHLESHSTLQDTSTKVDKEDPYLRSDNHRTDMPYVQTEALPSMEYHTPIPISSINRLHHWQHHSTQKGEKSKTDKESQLPSEHKFTELPLLSTEMQQDKETQKAAFIPITTQTRNPSSQSQPALMTSPDAHKAISRLSIAFSSTAQNTHTNGKHNHNFHTTPVQFTAITASSPNQIDLITEPQILQRSKPDENEILELNNAQFNHMIGKKLESLHHPKIPVYTTTTQIPSLDQNISYQLINHSPIPTSTTTSQNEDIMSTSQEIINLEKKRAQVMNEHQKYLESLTKDKANNPLHKIISEMKHSSEHDHQANLTYDTVTTQIPLLDETVDLSNSSNPYKPTYNYMTTQRNEEINKILEEIMMLEKEKREELINLHKEYLKSLLRNHEKPTITTPFNGESVETHETHKSHALDHTNSLLGNHEKPTITTSSNAESVEMHETHKSHALDHTNSLLRNHEKPTTITSFNGESVETHETHKGYALDHTNSLPKNHEKPIIITSFNGESVETHETHEGHALDHTNSFSQINAERRHNQEIPFHTTTAQVPLLDESMSYSTSSNPYKSTTPTLIQPNEDITKIFQEIMMLDKGRREELLSLHKEYLESLQKSHHEKLPHKIVSDMDTFVKHEIHEDHTMYDINSPSLINIRPSYHHDILSHSTTTTQTPLSDARMADSTFSNSHKSTTPTLIQPNEDITKILQEIMMLDKEKREELLSLHEKYLESLQKSYQEKLPHKIVSDMDTFVKHEIHEDHIMYDINSPSLINIRPSYHHDILSHSTTTTQTPFSDAKMADLTFSNSHKSTTPTLTQPDDDITKILEEIMMLKNKKREELINLSKNYHKSLPINDLDKPSKKIAADLEPSTKHKGHKDHTLDNPISPLPINVVPHHQLDSLSITHESFLDKELPHSNITSQDEDIARILEKIKKLEKDKREELIRIHKEYLESSPKNKANKSGDGSQSQSKLEHPSNHQINQDQPPVSIVSRISKVTLPSHKIPHQHKFSTHNHQPTEKPDGSVGEPKNKISFIYENTSSNPHDVSSTTVENERASFENEENIVQKPRLPQPPLNPNENWKFAAILDEFYEKQKNRTTPTPRRARPTLSIPTTTKPTPTSPSRMRTTNEYSPSRMRTTTEYSPSRIKTSTEYSPIPRVLTSPTNRLPYYTTAPTTTTDKSRSKGYSLNSTITRNYNITINLPPPQDSSSSSESSSGNDDLIIDPSSYSTYPVPDDIRMQSPISRDEFIGMSSSIPTNKSSQHSISADEYDVPYDVYQTPMDVGIPPPPPPPYFPPPYSTYPSPVPSIVPAVNPLYYALPYPPYSSLVPVQPNQFNGPFPIPLPQTSNDQSSTNDASLQNLNPHVQKSSEINITQQEDPKNEESGNSMTKLHSFSPTTDTRETTEQTQTLCTGENCTKKDCNNVYVIQDRSADMVNLILRFLNIQTPKNVTESIEPAILQSYLRDNSMMDNINLHSDTVSNMENMLNSIRGSTSIGSGKVQLHQSINDLLASLKQRRDQEYSNLYATRLNPNVGYGRDNVVAIMKINEYIELLELMLVYLARDPDKLLDESKDARISNDESPYPPEDPQRRLIEDQFYFVHPKILNEFIDVYKRYSKGDGYFGKPAWHHSQENGARSASRQDSLGKSLNQLFHLQGLLPQLIYDRSSMYSPGNTYIS